MNRAIKNVLSLVSGQTINLLLNLISLSLAARYLGVELFGKFSALLAIVILVSKTFDFGFPSIVFRELSIRSQDYTYLNSALTATFLFYLIISSLMNVIMIILSASFIEIIFVNILLLNAIISSKFNNVRELLNTPFKVHLRMSIPMIILIFDNLLFLLIVLLMPIFNGGLKYFIVGYVLANLPGFFVLLYMLNKEFSFRIRFELIKVRNIFSIALPLYGYLILDSVFQQADILLLNYFHNDFEVGIYSVAIRLVLPLLVIPYAFIQTVFPRIVQNLNVSNGANDEIIGIVYKVLVGIALIMALIFTFKSKEIIIFLFGTSYESAALSTTLLFWLQVFSFYNYFVINMLLAYNKQFMIFKYGTIVLLINISFNLILIPHLSFLGASISKLLAGISGGIFIIFVQHKLMLKMLSLEIRLLIWVVSITAFCFLFSVLPLIPFVILTTISFVIITMIIRYFNRIEILLMLDLLKNPLWGKWLLKLY